MSTTIIVFLILSAIVLVGVGIWAVVLARKHQRMPKLVTTIVTTVCVLVVVAVYALIQNGYSLEKTAADVADAKEKAGEALLAQNKVNQTLAEAKAAVKAVADVPDEIKDLRAKIEMGRTNSNEAHQILADGYTNLAKRMGAIETQLHQNARLVPFVPNDGQVFQPAPLQIPPQIARKQPAPKPTPRLVPAPTAPGLEIAVTKLSEQVARLDARMSRNEQMMEGNLEIVDRAIIQGQLGAQREAGKVVTTITLRSPKPLLRTIALWADSGQKDITYLVKIRLLKPVNEAEAEAFVRSVITRFNAGHGGKHYAYQNPAQERVQADFTNDFHHAFAGAVEKESRFAGALFIESATYVVGGGRQAMNGGAAKGDAPPPLVLAPTQ